jgi:hypothetical protein
VALPRLCVCYLRLTAGANEEPRRGFCDGGPRAGFGLRGIQEGRPLTPPISSGSPQRSTRSLATIVLRRRLVSKPRFLPSLWGFDPDAATGQIGCSVIELIFPYKSEGPRFRDPNIVGTPIGRERFRLQTVEHFRRFATAGPVLSIVGKRSERCGIDCRFRQQLTATFR